MKLKFFREADLELRQFENFDRAEFFYESHSDVYPSRQGSMVPFGFRLLVAELPQFLSRSDESLTMLCKLLDTVNSVIDKNNSFSSDQSILTFCISFLDNIIYFIRLLFQKLKMFGLKEGKKLSFR